VYNTQLEICCIKINHSSLVIRTLEKGFNITLIKHGESSMKKDDFQINRILSRRKTLALFRAIGTAILVAGCIPKKSRSTEAQSSVAVPPSSLANSDTLPTCIVTPQQTEGPYFVDEKLNRSDIRSDPADGSVKDGVPLQLTLRVSQIGNTSCTPRAGAIVDIWHCDALGVYSDVADPGFSTLGKKFLRGYQVTDANGTVQFTTIYPGWYQGRTVHIHFKVRTDAPSTQSYEFTSQLYFDDSITDQVDIQTPYASKGQRKLKNAGDGIFQDGGDQMLLKLTKTNLGYAATFYIGLQMD
jgi:protocatechuate 3,4-dioxygenase beta subunit